MPIPECAFDELWRVVCPDGHTRLNHRPEIPAAFCYSCGQMYDYDSLIDQKEAAQQSNRADARRRTLYD